MFIRNNPYVCRLKTVFSMEKHGKHHGKIHFALVKSTFSTAQVDTGAQQQSQRPGPQQIPSCRGSSEVAQKCSQGHLGDLSDKSRDWTIKSGDLSIKHGSFTYIIYIYNWLVVNSVNPSEKYESQLGIPFPIYGKVIILSCSKPPTR